MCHSDGGPAILDGLVVLRRGVSAEWSQAGEGRTLPASSTLSSAESSLLLDSARRNGRSNGVRHVERVTGRVGWVLDFMEAWMKM